MQQSLTTIAALVTLHAAILSTAPCASQEPPPPVIEVETLADPSRLDRFLIVKESRKSLWGDGKEAIRTLYTFENSPLCGPQEIATQDTRETTRISCVHSEYSVDEHADIIIDFNEALKNEFQGLIRVRARVLGTRPIELPVENFTIVSDDRLEQKLVVNIKDPKHFFRGMGLGEGFVQDLSKLDTLLIDYKALSNQLRTQLNNQPLKSTTQQLDGLGREIREMAFALQDQLRSRFLSAGTQLAVREQTFRDVRDISIDLIHRLSTIQSALENSFESQRIAVAQCPNDNADCHTKTRNQLRTSLDAAIATLLLTSAKTPQPNKLVTELLQKTDAIRSELTDDLTNRLVKRVRPGRIKLRQAMVKHGDIVEVIVTSSIAPLEFEDGTIRPTTRPVDLFEMRLRFRAVSTGFSSRVASSFVLINRLDDVQAATATDIPSTFKPTAGGALMFRYRTLGLWSDWLLPSFGLLVTAPDFDPRQTFEIGVGPTMGLLNESLHLGIGWNLSVSNDREYVLVGFDFLQTIDTFNALFGQ